MIKRCENKKREENEKKRRGIKMIKRCENRK